MGKRQKGRGVVQRAFVVCVPVALVIALGLSRVSVVPERLVADCDNVTPEKCSGDVALVPSGDPDNRRTRRAVELLRAGRVRKILITGRGYGGDSAWVLARFAIDVGARPEEVLVEPEATSTAENIARSLPILKEQKTRRVLIVTNAPNARRAVLLGEKGLTGMGVRVVVVPGTLGLPLRFRELGKCALSVVRGELSIHAFFE
ncbi:MAG: YdcF family protein [Deltaproteobacteria bacterium]|nr:YdcF family protein [Deltaproteobacteria bacterium]